jgi:hypothetical protein
MKMEGWDFFETVPRMGGIEENEEEGELNWDKLETLYKCHSVPPVNNKMIKKSRFCKKKNPF